MGKLIYVIVSKETGTLQNFVLEPQTDFFMALTGDEEAEVARGLLASTIDLVLGTMGSLSREVVGDPDMWDKGHELKQQIGEVEGVKIFTSIFQDVNILPELFRVLNGFNDSIHNFEVCYDDIFYDIGFTLGLNKRLENEEELDRSN